MRKIIESTFVTLDGVVSAPEKWSAPYWDEQHDEYSGALLRDADALLLGRTTYQLFAGSWPERSGDWYSDRINALPKYVATNTLTALTWNAQALDGDVVDAVRKLRDEGDGTLLKFGTGEFSKVLLEHQLVDEYHFWVFPVLAGQGSRLFDGRPMTHLTLVDAVRFKSGIVVHKAVPNR